MIPLAIPNLTGREAHYLQECITSTFVSSVGPFVTRFEEMVAHACGMDQAVAVSAGTTGLHAALTAVGVGRDDLVILPAYTFIASANAIAHCGAMPWLLDVEPESWTLDPALLKSCLVMETERKARGVIHRASGRRVAAIMPVYTLGNTAPMEEITTLARAHGLPVVADAAAALGATRQGRSLGELGADLTVFSFNGNKTVTTGGGGAVAGAKGETLALVRHLTTTARRGEEYDHDRVGFNYRMTNVQAALGCAQLERLETFVARKREIRAAYDAALAHVPGLSPFPQPPEAESACWFSGTVVNAAPDPSFMRTLRNRLRDDGIEARAFWKPMHLQEPYREAPRTPLPVTEAFWWRVLTLPCSTGLSEEDQKTVIQGVLRAMKDLP